MPTIPVSWGELFDKLTILSIKLEKLDGNAFYNVRNELSCLIKALPDDHPDELDPLWAALDGVNRRLWDVEDSVRGFEAVQHFGSLFIEMARQVYKLNDERARIKREINDLLGSEIVEEKQYTKYA